LDEYSKIEKEIIEITKLKKPSTGAELVELITEEFNISRELAIKYVLDLEDKRKILFIEQEGRRPEDIKEFLVSSKVYWYYLVMLVSVFMFFSSFISSPKTIISLSFTYLVGTFFVLFLPGYCITRILYSGNDVSRLHFIVYSIGISVSMASIIGVIMNYTPWGINKIPIVIMEFFIITFLSSYVVYKEFLIARKISPV
jgi:uncharacterized membrane protein